jgi:hypothetical protein
MPLLDHPSNQNMPRSPPSNSIDDATSVYMKTSKKVLKLGVWEFTWYFWARAVLIDMMNSGALLPSGAGTAVLTFVIFTRLFELELS